MQNPVVYSHTPPQQYPQVYSQPPVAEQVQAPLVAQQPEQMVPIVEAAPEPVQQAPKCKCKVKKVFKKIFMGFNVLVVLSQIIFFPASFLYSALSMTILGYGMSMKVYNKYGKIFLEEQPEKEKLARQSIFATWFFALGGLLTISTRYPSFLVLPLIIVGLTAKKVMVKSEKLNTKFHKHLLVYIITGLSLIFVSATLARFGRSAVRRCSTRSYQYRSYQPMDMMMTEPLLIPQHMTQILKKPSHSHPHRPSKPSQPNKPSKPSQPNKPSKPSKPTPSRHNHSHSHSHGCGALFSASIFFGFIVKLILFVWTCVVLIHFFIHRRALKKAMLPVVEPENTYVYPNRVPQVVVPQPAQPVYAPQVPQQVPQQVYLPQVPQVYPQPVVATPVIPQQAMVQGQQKL